MSQIIAQGAEATIEKQKNNVIKKRLAKIYRLPELDLKIRTKRTKSEAKLLEKASKITNIPKIKKINVNNSHITLEFIDGKKLSEHLDKLKKKLKIAEQIGQEISKLHKENIIHGDLTTSNMILNREKVFFIDFGLGFISQKIEDKAVDLHLLKQALEAKHFKNFNPLWKAIEKSYSKSSEGKKVLERLKAVEKRGRHKDKY